MKRYVLLFLLVTVMCTLFGCQHGLRADKEDYNKQITDTSASTGVYNTAEGGNTDAVVNLTEDELVIGINKVANAILKDRLTITIRYDTTLVTVFYEGPHNGGSKQTQESVDAAFDAVRAYLNAVGMSEYTLVICGYDGFPKADDKEPIETPNNNDVQVPDGIPYTLIERWPNTKAFVFEVVATESTADTIGVEAFELLKNKLGDDEFKFFVVDESEKVLGSGSQIGYEPFVYNKKKEAYDSGSYTVPFDFYIAKYIGFDNFRGYDPYSGLIAGGKTSCEFEVRMRETKDIEKYKTAAQKILELMNLTLGQDVRVVITVFPNTKSEFTVETVFKEDVFPWIN